LQVLDINDERPIFARLPSPEEFEAPVFVEGGRFVAAMADRVRLSDRDQARQPNPTPILKSIPGPIPS